MKNRIGFFKKDIKRNVGRFAAILIITALSVGFLTGLVSIAPDMEYTADKYYDASNFWDINIKSTLGFTPEDVTAIKKQAYVKDACGLITLDATASHNLEGNYPIRIYAVDFDNDIATGETLAAPVLLEGSYPINSTSCVVLRSYALKNDIKIGDKIYLNSGGDILSEIAFTVTGVAESPEFASGDRQVTTSGDNVLSMAIYVSKSVYHAVGIYTDVLVTVKDADRLDTFSDEYVQRITAAKKQLEKLSDEREKLREDSITSQQQSVLGQITSNYTEYQQSTQSELAAQKQYVNRLKKDIEKAEKEINEKKEKLTAAKAALDLQAPEIEALKLKGEATTDEEKAIISKYQSELTKYNKDVKALTKKENILKVDKTIYEQAKKSYEKNRNQANKELANAHNQYEDYKGQEQASGKQSWSIADRTQNASFLGFKSNVDKIRTIARVFPIAFFAIAIAAATLAVCRNTQEQSREIGVLKSVGYSDKMIIKRNVKYSLTATVTGVVLGLVVGILILPLFIYETYSAVYSYGPLGVLILPEAVIPPILLSFLCVIGAGYIVCKNSLELRPAGLILSKRFSKPTGVIFERLEKLWSKLNPSCRIVLRNLIRNKKRFIITAVGVAGCTALLLTAFGLHNSVTNVDRLQYERIQQYDASLSLKNGVDFAKAGTLKKTLDNKEYVEKYSPIYNEAMSYSNDGNKISITATVPLEEKSFNKLVSLRTRAFGKQIDIGDKNIVLSENTASACGVKVGDTLKLTTAAGIQTKFKVGAITENYVGNIIYITPAAYKKAIGSDVAANGVLVRYAGGVTNDKFDQAVKNTGLILGATYSADTVDYVNQKMSNIGHIIQFLIAATVLLMLAVVYILTDMNISDRKREIKSIKALGLTNREVVARIYGETVISAVIGIVLGLLLGTLLHVIVVSTSDMADIMLGRSIGFGAFVLTVGLALAAVALCAVSVLLKIKKARL